MSDWPWPERYSCDGDGYHDVYDSTGNFVVGPRPCLGCPDCEPERAEPAEEAETA